MQLEQRWLRNHENNLWTRRFDKIREMIFGMYCTATNLSDYSMVIFLTRIGSRHRFSYWNETGLKWTRPKFLLRKLFWLIWKQFHSDWIKMCHMPYETSVNETGFKWTEIISLTKILVWSIWNQFHSISFPPRSHRAIWRPYASGAYASTENNPHFSAFFRTKPTLPVLNLLRYGRFRND